MRPASSPTTDAAAQLHRLRAVVRRNPAVSVDHLRRLSDPTLNGAADPATRVDIFILLAEAHLRHRDLPSALDASSIAAGAAGNLQPLDWQCLTIAIGVGADIAVLAHLPEAVEACDSYLTAVNGGEPPDQRRDIMAHALRAAAAYHHADCGAGHTLLTAVLDRHPHHHDPRDPTTVMISAALTAMQDGCRGMVRSVAGAPPPLPGGILQPHLTNPQADYLAYRIGAYPPAHPEGRPSPCPTTSPRPHLP